MNGAYIFTDLYTGELMVLDEPKKFVQASPFVVNNTYESPDQTMTTLPRFQELGVTQPWIVSFAEDEDREMYGVALAAANSYMKGKGVYRLVPTSGSPPADTIPEKLSLRGCVDPQIRPNRPPGSSRTT